MMFVRPSVYLFGTGMHLIKRLIIQCTLVQISICSWIIQCSGHCDTKHVHILPAVFFQFHLEERLGNGYGCAS